MVRLGIMDSTICAISSRYVNTEPSKAKAKNALATRWSTTTSGYVCCIPYSCNTLGLSRSISFIVRALSGRFTKDLVRSQDWECPLLSTSDVSASHSQLPWIHYYTCGLHVVQYREYCPGCTKRENVWLCQIKSTIGQEQDSCSILGQSEISHETFQRIPMVLTSLGTCYISETFSKVPFTIFLQ